MLPPWRREIRHPGPSRRKHLVEMIISHKSTEHSNRTAIQPTNHSKLHNEETKLHLRLESQHKRYIRICNTIAHKVKLSITTSVTVIRKRRGTNTSNATTIISTRPSSSQPQQLTHPKHAASTAVHRDRCSTHNSSIGSRCTGRTYCPLRYHQTPRS